MTDIGLRGPAAGTVCARQSDAVLHITVTGRLAPDGLDRLAALVAAACDGTVQRLVLTLADVEAVRHVAVVRAALAAVPPGARRPPAIELSVPSGRTAEHPQPSHHPPRAG